MTDTRNQGLVAGGAALALVATILPWLEANSAIQQFGSSSGEASMNGLGIMELQPLFSGPVTAIVAVVAVGVVFFASEKEWADVAVMACGGLVALVALLWILMPGTIVGGGMGGAMIAAMLGPGLGIYLTVLGGILILAGGALSYTSDDARAVTAPA